MSSSGQGLFPKISPNEVHVTHQKRRKIKLGEGNILNNDEGLQYRHSKKKIMYHNYVDPYNVFVYMKLLLIFISHQIKICISIEVIFGYVQNSIHLYSVLCTENVHLV